MWPKSKARNKRKDRESVLDVKMRSRDIRAWRIRALAAAVGVIGGTAIGAVLVWQAYQYTLLHFVYRNEAYAIRRVELRHEGRIRPDQLQRWSGIQLGENLIALDPNRVRHGLELNPWIERADVECRRPGTVLLTVHERDPITQVVVWRLDRQDGRAWPETNLIDAQGWVLPPLRADWLKPGADADFGHLTRLVGLDNAEIVPGQNLRYPGLREGLSLVRAYEASSMYSLVDLEELDLSKAEAPVGRLRQGTVVVFGTSDFERQMRRWRSIHDFSVEQGRQLDWIDLSVTNNIPARWRARPDTTPAPPRTPKPKRTPKPHV
ncbi:MAG: FtsQ-type POTRA domain-containing protein [Verrucomicrobiales bacterium]|nr:FtsQ-type POTRA domain-containing protein [Verrucomicrobiales bacterium]